MKIKLFVFAYYLTEKGKWNQKTKKQKKKTQKPNEMGFAIDGQP